MTSIATVVLLGALDTKGPEHASVRDRLREAGIEVTPGPVTSMTHQMVVRARPATWRARARTDRQAPEPSRLGWTHPAGSRNAPRYRFAALRVALGSASKSEEYRVSRMPGSVSTVRIRSPGARSRRARLLLHHVLGR
jgi:hypothetical protein